MTACVESPTGVATRLVLVGWQWRGQLEHTVIPVCEEHSDAGNHYRRYAPAYRGVFTLVATPTVAVTGLQADIVPGPATFAAATGSMTIAGCWPILFLPI